jgi:hypothetical protein
MYTFYHDAIVSFYRVGVSTRAHKRNDQRLDTCLRRGFSQSPGYRKSVSKHTPANRQSIPIAIFMQGDNNKKQLAMNIAGVRIADASRIELVL